MNKYYLVIIKNDSQAINAYDTANAAIGAFHGEMQYAHTADIPTTCYVLDALGNRTRFERYDDGSYVYEQDPEVQA